MRQKNSPPEKEKGSTDSPVKRTRVRKARIIDSDDGDNEEENGTPVSDRSPQNGTPVSDRSPEKMEEEPVSKSNKPQNKKKAKMLASDDDDDDDGGQSSPKKSKLEETEKGDADLTEIRSERRSPSTPERQVGVDNVSVSLAKFSKVKIDFKTPLCKQDLLGFVCFSVIVKGLICEFVRCASWYISALR